MEEELIENIKKEFDIMLRNTISLAELEAILTEYINKLILTNFQKLVTILYRIDVSEAKLKYLLKIHATENAGSIIAKLIIERQVQKINSRQQFKQAPDDIADDEKW